MKGNISQARINQQIRNMLKQPLTYLTAAPLQNDIYTWHFTIQGPEGSDFHQGLYHGQILLPFQYPFKPPDIIFMNKNGRFQVNTKICLTITQYHPQEWNSAWTIRTMLQAVISLFNENVQGIGYEEGSPEQRKSLAKKSHFFKCDKCGILKDNLKPRQELKVQQKKETDSKVQNEPVEKLEYAPQLNFRKVKTQDSRNFASKNSVKGKIQREKSQVNPKNINKTIEEAKNQETEANNKDNKKNSYHLKIYYPDNDAIALNIKAAKNYATWARVLKSQKWSVIQ